MRSGAAVSPDKVLLVPLRVANVRRELDPDQPRR